jgi:hypothetical protein
MHGQCTVVATRCNRIEKTGEIAVGWKFDSGTDALSIR